MPVHITARLAWHDDGWNGSICSKPERNTYCVGCKSYPGDVIAETRDLEVETKFAGVGGKDLFEKYTPPCCYSYNAFGLDEAPAASEPPHFFHGGAKRREWTLDPATTAVWPYDAMYEENVRANGYLDNDQRRANTIEYFKPIESGDNGRSLVFYYANYSNPFSEEDSPRYVLVGVSRILKLGEELRYEDVTEQVAERYAGGMVWARNVQSAYPEEGLRLPYHLYRDDPELLRKIALFPEDPLLCKMGSKHLTDDDAIGLLEQFLAKVCEMRELGDKSENWAAREDWLSSQIAALWQHRGIYPGLLRSLEVAGAKRLIPFVKMICTTAGEEKAKELAFEVLENGAENDVSRPIPEPERKLLKRSWNLKEDDERRVLEHVFPRFDFEVRTMKNIMSEQRSEFGITASLTDIADNPYLLAEQYRGEAADDLVPWSAVDRGVLPPADLGEPLVDVTADDARRFRALCVDHLRREPNDTFRFTKELLTEIAERMARLPHWKQATFKDRIFVADADFLDEALEVATEGEERIAYLKSVFQDERLIERTISELLSRPVLDLRRPVTELDWRSWVYKSESLLARCAADQYQQAVAEQITTCSKLLPSPFAVVTGAAGTGKTTVIEALVRAIRKTEGEGTSILVAAPTGKAADRVREILGNAGLKGIETRTVHSFLAEAGWLNDNLTFKRQGGKKKQVETLVVDETSMLDVELAAAFFRAVDWPYVRRLILVGDAGQLPPIGRGRMFADVIGWLKANRPECLGKLEINIRQMRTRAEGKGQSIVELSKLFIIDDPATITLQSDEDVSAEGQTSLGGEELIEKIHAGGKIDEDLDVIYWDDEVELSGILIDAIEKKMGAEPDDARKPYQVWKAGLEGDPTRFQVLTPRRGELYGLEALNRACQKRIAQSVVDRIGAVDGITLFDKVIQIKNRPKSNPIWAYDWTARQQVAVEAFNGEIGIAEPFGFDDAVVRRLKTGYGPRLKRFSVRFTRKPKLTVGYGRDVPQLNGRGYPIEGTESVEENLELAYAISIHKAQGSEFEHTFVVVPAAGARPLSTELVYTAITRASAHCTLLLQRDVGSLLEARRRENARTPQINSTLFGFHAAPPELARRGGWYESGKIHQALSGDMVRSKSEVIIANLLHEHELPFYYERLLRAPDGTMKLPDFTVTWAGRTYYLEHLGRLDLERYAKEWAEKREWYEKWFPEQLLVTTEASDLSRQAAALIDRLKSGADAGQESETISDQT